MQQGDLCITRAGASSLAELSFLKIPFVAIPLPSAKDNHKYENAKYYKDQDCCWIIDQKSFDNQKFEEFLFKLINFSNFLKIVNAKTSKSSFESIFSLKISVLQVK